MINIFKRKSELEEKDLLLRRMMVKSKRSNQKALLSHQSFIRALIILFAFGILAIGFSGVFL